MSIERGSLLLLFVLVLAATPFAGAEQAAPLPVSAAATGIETSSPRAAAALLVPAGGSLGQLILPQRVGPGELKVPLSSSHPELVSVPFRIFVPAGANSVTFPIQLFSVAAPTRVTITAETPFGPVAATTQLVPPFVSLAPALATDPVNLLVNGSFEEPVVPAGQPRLPVRGTNELSGWRLLGAGVTIVLSLPMAPVAAPESGRQRLELAGPGGAGAIEQTFPTEPGRTYLLSGWISHAVGVSEGKVKVSLNGEPLVQVEHADAVYGKVTATDPRWAPFSCPFRATEPITTLTLTDVTGPGSAGGAALDGLAITVVDTGGPPLTPATPLGLVATAASSTEVTLSWRDASENETAFAVWRRGGGSDSIPVGVLAPNSTSFTDRGLTPGTVYGYRVRAINHTVSSAWSNEAAVTTRP